MTDLDPHPDFRRDRYGRPLIIPPGGGNEQGYTRCTTYIGVLEDTYRLQQYKMRNVAAGIGQRPDLHVRAASLGLEPADPDAARDWKSDMNELCDKAVEAAAASAKATIGSSLHTYTEKIDRGQDPGHVPDQYRKHLDTWRRVTAGIRWIHIEQRTVCDQLKVAGTPDRVGYIPGHNGLVIADTKSGRTDFGLLKMCMQLAIYSRSVIYDPRTGERTPFADHVDLDRGLILPLNSITGECQPFWVDLDKGWQAVQAAGIVRGWRSVDNKRQLTQPYQPTTQPALMPAEAPIAGATPGTPMLTVLPGGAEAGAALVNAIQAAASADQLIELWRAAGQAWTEHHTALASQRKTALQNGTPA